MSSHAPCAYCERVEDPDISTDDRQRLFHQQCDGCAPNDSTNQQGSLCAFCNHLRLRHVLFCPDEVSRCEFELGSLQDVESRRTAACSLCEIIYTACKMALELEEHKNRAPASMVFGLDLFKVDLEIIEFASIHLRIYDSSGDPIDTIEACRVYAQQDEDVDCPTSPMMNSANTDLVRPVIDWKRAKGWLSRCCAEHDGCRHTRLAAPPPGFRVIDVETRQLVRPQGECQFIALSYVWGANPDPSRLQTTISNVSRLEKTGALKSSEIPAAIDEAMQVCRELGESYLWADRLCIVQDDPVNKKDQILSMVDIYSSAVLVVTLCAGASMDDSIPGIASLRPSFKKTIVLDSLLVTTMLPTFGKAVLPSTWASRGWTYQEAALPTRRLYFTPFQLIYECRAGHVYEDNFLNDSPWCNTDIPCGGGYQNRMPVISRAYKDDASRFESYRNHVQNYNTRLLTYGSDIYNAFAGAMSGLYGKGAATAHGLPLVNFDEALLWYPAVESHENAPVYRVSDNPRLPTWSWSSVSGKVSHLDVGLGFKGSIVRWARISGTGAKKGFEPIWESDSPIPEEWAVESDPGIPKISVLRRPQLYMALAASEGCFEALDNLGLDCHKATSFVGAASRAAERWPQYRDFRREAFDRKVPHIKPQDTPTTDGLAISTRAQLARLTLGEHVHQRSFGPCNYESVWLDIRVLDGICIGLLAPSPSLSGWAPPPEDSLFEFIGISISALPVSSLGGTLGCVYSSTDYGFDSIGGAKVNQKLREIRHLGCTYWDADGESLNPIPVVNVMLIERKGGVGTRVSIGWVLLAQWARLERRYETIVLV